MICCKIISERGIGIIMNYSIEGKQAVHNSSYWEGVPYLGVGPSAHSFDGNSRQWNIANNQLYAKSDFGGQDFYEKEILSGKDKYHDALISRMRTKKGIELSYIVETCSKEIADHFKNKADSLNAFIHNDELRYSIREEYWLTSDEILAKLMLDD